LAFFGALTAMQTNISAVFLSIKKPEILSYLSMGYLLLLLPLSVTLTLYYGALGAAWSYLITSALMLPVFYFVTFRYIDLKIHQFLSMVWRPIISVVIMYSCLHYLLSWIKVDGSTINQIILLLLTITVGALCYGGVLVSLWLLSSKPEGAESYILSKTVSTFKSRFSNAR
jgi:O-antigen/teichoic acid export membrane protein